MNTPVVNWSGLAIISLRSSALLASLQGQHELARMLNAAATAASVGHLTDQHMAEVARSIESGEEPDFAAIRDRIVSHSAKLQAAQPID